VVFATNPSFKSIQTAGVIASYFGLLSESRPVRFPVHLGDIPAGNAILIAESAASLPPGFNLPEATLPTVAVRTNPNDPYGKLLILTGANADQALMAAQAVALRSDMLSGPQASIESLRLPAKQTPDAAPRWARIDQKIPLWDYASETQVQGDGTAPLNVYFRIPPDLYYSDQRPNAVLRLAYRYNSVPIGPISSLQIRVNNAFIQSVPLTPGQDTSKRMEIDVPIPIVNLRPFSNSLTFDFTFQLVKKGSCEDTTPINMQGAILRDSYIDISGYPHYAPLPNLEVFANAGFPFTRLADLSESTVVLPPSPTGQEIETFITMMGHFSRQTGFPALRIAVAGPEALRDGAHSDFLVIGSGDDQPAFDRLESKLAVSLRSGQIQVHDTQGFFSPLLHHAWWKAVSNEHAESGDLVAGGTPQAVIEGIESPFDPQENRSIVAIHLKDSSALAPFIGTFLDIQQASDISGSVSVLKGSDQNAQFQSFRIGSKVYYLGTLPWWTRLELWFTRVPWLAAVIVIAFAFLLAIWTRLWLRSRARARLRMTEE
jgi:cellulose synthase (UDP-forming)